METARGESTRLECAPLAAGTSLHRRYTVRRVLLRDAFSVLYDAFDCRAHQPVVVEEFFPTAIAARATGATAVSPRDREAGELFFCGSEAFLRQYGVLTQAIGSPNILSVFEAFFENGTAYALTEPLDGVTLTDYLELRGRTLDSGELVYILRAIADALLVVHSLNTLHHGITGDTILLGTDGTVKLARFCAGRATVERRRAVDDTAVWADIRALGAALYRAYTGRAPDGVRLGPGTPASIASALTAMLSDNPAERCETVFDLRYLAYGIEVAPVCPAVTLGEIGAFRRARQRKNVAVSDAGVRESPKDGAAREAENRHASPAGLRVACGIGVVLAALLGVLIWALTKRG